MKHLLKKLKLHLNNDSSNPKKSVKVLGISKRGNKFFKHTIDYTGKIKLLEL